MNTKMKINTGRDLIESNILTFNVLNGGWKGNFIRNFTEDSKRYALECLDYNGYKVNTINIKKDTELNLDIEVLECLGSAKLVCRRHSTKQKIEGMDEFGKEIAEKLYNKFPNIDFFDLIEQFKSSFEIGCSKIIEEETDFMHKNMPIYHTVYSDIDMSDID